MKKIKLSLVLALLSMCTLVSAQSASLIIKGGLNMSNFYGNNLSDKNVKPGFHVGVGADLEFLHNVSLQTGLFYSAKGAKYTYYSKLTEDVEFNVSANYIQLPIHLAYKIDVKPGTKLVFHAGPYLSYGIGGKKNIDNFRGDLEQLFGEQEVNTFDKDHGLKRFDTGVGIGVGVEFGIITVDLGWDIGLTDLARENKALVAQKSIKTQSAYLSLGYKF